LIPVEVQNLQTVADNAINSVDYYYDLLA